MSRLTTGKPLAHSCLHLAADGVAITFAEQGLMISRHDLERLLAREDRDGLVLSMFLDMSVNSDNKRTHEVFLSQQRSAAHSNPDLATALERVGLWLRDEFQEENNGVAIYTDVGGDWFEGLQFPVSVPDRIMLDRKPAIAPLARILESRPHHGIILLDRRHVRILSVFLGTVLEEIERVEDFWPTPNDVQVGGYAQKGIQSYKAEEVRRFFRDFARDVEDFVTRARPDDLVLLGTMDNTANFREFLSTRALNMIAYTGSIAVDEPAPQVVLAIEPILAEQRERESQEMLKVVRERVAQDYLATAGFQSTLAALQDGKVDSLVLGQEQALAGARCGTCGFIFAQEVDICPYDGSPVTGVDVVEETIRMAEAQGVEIRFVPAATIQDLHGVGTLLRF